MAYQSLKFIVKGLVSVARIVKVLPRESYRIPGLKLIFGGHLGLLVCLGGLLS